MQWTKAPVLQRLWGPCLAPEALPSCNWGYRAATYYRGLADSDTEVAFQRFARLEREHLDAKACLMLLPGATSDSSSRPNISSDILPSFVYVRRSCKISRRGRRADIHSEQIVDTFLQCGDSCLTTQLLLSSCISADPTHQLERTEQEKNLPTKI